jgi:hypothetical protein
VISEGIKDATLYEEAPMAERSVNPAKDPGR